MIRRALVTGVLMMLLAACGGNDDAATTAGANTQAESTTTTAVESGSTSSATTGADVVPIAAAPCDLLTADEVEEATGLPVVEVIDEPPITCLFDLGADAGVDLFVVVEDGEGRLRGPAAVFAAYAELVADGEAEPIDGLGAAALYAPGFRGLEVDAGGGRFVGIGINGGFTELADPRDELITLARLMLSRL
jgi:hypothetical protein